jgi:hypothetical protein
VLAPLPARAAAGLAALGEWMRLHARVLQGIQWGVVAAYGLLVVVPAFLPLPPDDAHWYNSMVVAAQCCSGASGGRS